MEGFLVIWLVVGVPCAIVAAFSVPDRQMGSAAALGFFLGPFGVIVAVLISIRKAIEGEQPRQPTVEGLPLTGPRPWMRSIQEEQSVSPSPPPPPRHP